MSLVAKDIIKKFGNLTILKGIDLEIKDGEMVSIVGRSGSGKSTLLYIISGLDTLDEGTVSYDQKNLNDFSLQDLHDYRNKQIGFVFQFHYLLGEFSVLENVLMPAMKTNETAKYKKRAIELLDLVGLSDKIHKNANGLSGGEQQRVAIARAMVMSPKYLFADEPTGNLDSANATQVLTLFKQVNQDLGTTVVYVTHDEGYAHMAQRKITLVDGMIAQVDLLR